MKEHDVRCTMDDDVNDAAADEDDVNDDDVNVDDVKVDDDDDVVNVDDVVSLIKGNR